MELDTAPSYVFTNALIGGISIGITPGGYPRRVVTETGNKNQHVWTLTKLPSGNYSIGTATDTTVVRNGLLCGVERGSSNVEWKISPSVINGYHAHTIAQTGVRTPGYWVLGPRGVAPGTQISVVPKPPGGPNDYPGALWIFTTVGELPGSNSELPDSDSELSNSDSE
ncbi:hypothetical protein BD779DRAFT_802602 [Infundibulicybe gibba]|nr:hypothetical protein BD779DRAFT_802602 [Infundibulicybe gibba]